MMHSESNAKEEEEDEDEEDFPHGEAGTDANRNEHHLPQATKKVSAETRKEAGIGACSHGHSSFGLKRNLITIGSNTTFFTSSVSSMALTMQTQSGSPSATDVKIDCQIAGHRCSTCYLYPRLGANEKD